MVTKSLETITKGAVVPFFHICSDFFQQKWFPNDPRSAGFVMSVPDLISAVASPLCGLLVDQMGHASTMIPIAGLFLMISHILLIFTQINPIYTISIMGISYSLFGAGIWPCVPFLVKRHQIATAYGLVTVCLNASLFFFPILVAKIRNMQNDFTYVEYFFIALSLIGILLSIYLRQHDIKNGNKLNKRLSETELCSDLTESLNDDHEPRKCHVHFESPEIVINVPHKRHYPSEHTVKVVGEGIPIHTPHTYKERSRTSNQSSSH